MTACNCKSSAGCSICNPSYTYWPTYPWPTWPQLPQYPADPTPPYFPPYFPQPQIIGCICPPTSEQTCQNQLCPRKAIVSTTSTGTGSANTG